MAWILGFFGLLEAKRTSVPAADDPGREASALQTAAGERRLIGLGTHAPP